jgi:hypothetical protein
MRPRYLTKSRYILGLNCPTKLYFTGKAEYPDRNEDNLFQKALAEGGYQVGALAKCYFPGGLEISSHDYSKSVYETEILLQQPEVVIYEGAFLFEHLFIRADIVQKSGNVINLFEVKSKSYDGIDHTGMMSGDYIDSGWIDYLQDVAFQKYVITKAHPEFQVNAFLMLANKNAAASVDGLNQKFQLVKIENERTYVNVVGDNSPSALGAEILIRVNVDDLIDRIWNNEQCKVKSNQSFNDKIKYLADAYWNDIRVTTPISKSCKDCEFQPTADQEKEGMVSGFKECWKSQLGWSDKDFDEPLIFELWNHRGNQKLLDKGIYRLKDIQESHFCKTESQTNGRLSNSERQWLQVEKVKNNDSAPYINILGLREEFSKFVFPLHFIDFETTMVAIPFYSGRRPYEQTAFQFSHHIVTSDLKIEHAGEYICREKGKFPNFEFVKELQKQIGKDNGTIFRYAEHENTVLNQIAEQFQDTNFTDEPEKENLTSFIRSITKSDQHRGERVMVDLKNLVVKHYYHPLSRGSNSLKYVLPAVLSSSQYIQQKYSQPVYGKTSLIRSLNYEDGWIWIKKDPQGNVINPYKLLQDPFEGVSETHKNSFLMKGGIREGGAAMTAYGMMQFTEISNYERELIANALLRYCELDTFAMVLIWEYWNQLVNRN